MKKLVTIFVALFVSAGFVGSVSAADKAAPGPHHQACKEKADAQKLTGEKADKAIEKCEKEAAGGK